MPNLGTGELVVILMLVVLVFGATRLPLLGEGIGKAVSSFKRALGKGDDTATTRGDGNGEG